MKSVAQNPPTPDEKPPEQTQALATTQSAEVGMGAMLERLALDPQVDVAKLSALIGLHVASEARRSKQEFTAAFARMQPMLPAIPRNGKVMKKGGIDVQSRYELMEDIQSAVFPVLKKYGFALSHRTEWPGAEEGSDGKPVRLIRVVGILSHRDGHERESVFMSSADTSGNKNTIQGLGSTVSYGRRYTTRDLLNLNLGGLGKDDDGADSEQAPEAPAGYEDWMTDMSSAADTGWAAVSKAWRTSKQAFRDHATKHDAQAWKALKDRAQAVDAKR